VRAPGALSPARTLQFLQTGFAGLQALQGGHGLATIAIFGRKDN
jgi:hypothetical protein